jgi:hypothetical protein
LWELKELDKLKGAANAAERAAGIESLTRVINYYGRENVLKALRYDGVGLDQIDYDTAVKLLDKLVPP